MRDPNRIYKICHKLAEIWSQVPDWRLGQLMTNINQVCKIINDKDPFYVEDDELIKFMEHYVKGIKKNDQDWR